MGKCNIYAAGSLTDDDLQTRSIFVDMYCYGYSDRAEQPLPLITWGAGPCMIAVFHNRVESRGCLAHIAAAGENKDMMDHFERATDQLTRMFERSGKPTAADIYLLAGRSFVYETEYPQANPERIDYSAHLQKFLYPFKDPSYQVHRYNAVETGQVLYWPSKDSLFILSNLELQTLQARVIKADAQRKRFL